MEDKKGINDCSLADAFAWTQIKNNVQSIGLVNLFTNSMFTKHPVEVKHLLEMVERAATTVIAANPSLAKTVQSMADDRIFAKEAAHVFNVARKDSFASALDIAKDSSIRLINIAYEGALASDLEMFFSMWRWETFPLDAEVKNAQEDVEKQTLSCVQIILTEWVSQVGRAGVCSYALANAIEQVYGLRPKEFEQTLNENHFIRKLLKIYDQSGAQPLPWKNRNVLARIIDDEADLACGDENHLQQMIEWCARYGGPADTGTPLDFATKDEKDPEQIHVFICVYEKENHTEAFIKERERWEILKDLSANAKKALYEERMTEFYGGIPLEFDETVRRITRIPIRLKSSWSNLLH